jgi:hypothetical protein
MGMSDLLLKITSFLSIQITHMVVALSKDSKPATVTEILRLMVEHKKIVVYFRGI